MANFWPNTSKPRLDRKCQECGCNCDSCVNNNSIHLHQEIEDLKDCLTEKDRQIISMESQILSHAKQYPGGEMQALRENLYFCQDKYERLLESYRKLQKVNQGLEDKLLRIADKFENEKIELTHRVTELTCKLDQTQSDYVELQHETARYKNDCNLAINLLQCKPSQFVSHKLDSLPDDVQDRAQHYLNFRRPQVNNDNIDNHNNKFGGKLIRVPISTFPPTAMVYSLNEDKALPEEVDTKPVSNYVSASIMAKILEEREKERYNESRCVNCYNKDQQHDTIQTKSQLSIRIDNPKQTTTSETTSIFRQINIDNFPQKGPRPNSETIINI